MATIRFDANVPVELALKFDTGKQVQSRIPDAPDQMMFTVCGDDTIYVPLHVAEQIKTLGIRKMELISICKRVQNNVTKWEVKRVGDTQTAAIAAPVPPAQPAGLPVAIDATPMERLLTESINNVLKAQRALAPATPVCSGQSNSNTTGNSTPIQHTSYSRVMAGALIAAIDAAREAERYAASVGFEVEFNTEDVRAIASTLFIQASKDPAFLSQPVQKVNGGASWQQ